MYNDVLLAGCKLKFLWFIIIYSNVHLRLNAHRISVQFRVKVRMFRVRVKIRVRVMAWFKGMVRFTKTDPLGKPILRQVLVLHLASSVLYCLRDASLSFSGVS